MGLLKRAARGLARQIARRVAENELFEKPGERPRTPPLGPQGSPQVSAPAPAPAPAPAGPSRPSPVVPAAPAQSAARPAAARPPSSGAAGPGASAPCRVASLDDLRAALGAGGGWRVVNHWATWCIPCVEEFPELLRLREQLGPGVELSGVSWDLFDPRGDEDDIVEHVENFAIGHGLLWESLLIGEAVEAADFFAAFGVEPQTVPQTWVIDPSGQVRLRVTRALTESDLDEILAALPADASGASPS